MDNQNYITDIDLINLILDLNSGACGRYGITGKLFSYGVTENSYDTSFLALGIIYYQKSNQCSIPICYYQ